MLADAARLSAPSAAVPPLIGCLVLLTAHFEHPKSADALLAGVPTTPQGFGIVDFVRAASRAGYQCRILRRSPRSLARSLLPAVLLLTDDRAVVLVEIDAGHQRARIRDPATGGLDETMPLGELDRLFAGYAILVKPSPEAAGGMPPPPQPRRAWFWGTVVQYWPIYLQAMLLGLLVNLAALAIPLFSMNVYDRVVPNNAIETLWVLAIGAALVIGIDFAMRLVRAHLLEIAGRRIDVLLSSTVFNHVLDLQLAARPASAGAFANQLREFEQVRDFFTSATLVTFIDLPFACLFLAIIALIGGELAWLPALAFPAVLLLGLASQIPLRRAVRASLVESSRKHGVLVEAIGALEIVKALGAQGRLQAQWERAVGAAASAGHRARIASGFAVNLAALAQYGAAIGVLVLGVHLIGEGELTIGGLIACSILSSRALAPTAQIANLLARYNQAATALAALDRVLKLPSEHAPDRRYVHRPISEGRIAFQHVRFGYPGTASPSLDDVSFTIHPGERVAFIGRIGCGKTTIARLAMRLFEPEAGNVLVDGVDLRQIDPADLRRGIGYVPQEPHLLQGSVRDNITLRLPSADDASLLEVARLAGVDDFVRLHPQGYDLPVGERGERLSGGQRQAVGIARGLLGDPPILIFDEPTSAMDHTSEMALIQRLLPVVQGRTLLLMTHRTSMLALVDRVIVLDQGRVVADGAKDHVLRALRDGGVRMAQR